MDNREYIKYKINSDLCTTCLGYSCPECNREEFYLDKYLIGWTEIKKTFSNKIAPAVVYECPDCFTKIATHIRSDELDFYIKKLEKKEIRDVYK